MRSLGLSLVLVACTLDNPAFHASTTEATTAGTSSAVTTENSGSTTDRPTTSTSPTTSTTGPDATTHAATTMNVSDSDATTDPPSATTTTDWPMTASSDPGTTTGTTGPMMCNVALDGPGPLVRMQSLPNFFPVPAAECAPLQQTALGGRLEIDNAGFFIKPDVDCAPNNLFVPGIRIMVPMPAGAAGHGSCVTFSYLVHPGYDECVLSALWVDADGQQLIVGSFGNKDTPPDTPFQIQYEPKGACVCPGCCDPWPDPDIYKLVTLGAAVSEGTTADVLVGDAPWAIRNLRAHVHAPDCTGGAPPPEWLHFDWLAARVQ